MMTKIKESLTSRKWRQSHLYHIIDKQSNKVIFKRNEPQQELKKKMDEIKKKDGRVRLIILKGRQLGITTDACMRLLDEVVMKKNRNVAITAHEQSKQKEIFEKVKLAYDNMPQVKRLDGTTWGKPKTKYYTKTQLTLRFSDESQSTIQVTLNSRSGTLSSRHITELAFRDDAKDMMTSSLPSVPKHADIVIETTANGVGNYFHKLWTDNYNNPDANRHCMFLARYWDDTYTLPIDRERSLPEELQHLDDVIDHRGERLTEGQKYRYYRQRKDLGRDVFQEYPSTPEEAFLTSGDTVITQSKISNLTSPEIIDEPLPGLHIFRKPSDEERLYFRGVDTAEGGENGDYSSIEIRDSDYKLYAHYYRKTPPEDLVSVMDKLWQMGYVSINMGVERNGVGLATITSAKEYDWFDYIYNETKVDERTQTPSKKFGLHTGSNRKSMIEHRVGLIRKDVMMEFDPRTVAEMYTFVYGNNNRPEASANAHDDAIMTSVICCRTIETRQVT